LRAEKHGGAENESHGAPLQIEIRNPNIEIRNKFKIRNAKAQNEKLRVLGIWIWFFEIVSDFEFRISDFSITATATPEG
jgi:hypothetical protein